MLEIKGLKVTRGNFSATLPHLVVNDGECVALCGVSGSGKSTLLESIGLLKPWVSVDSFVLNQVAIDLLDAKEAQALRVCELGIMPQVGGLIPYLSIKENLEIQIELALRQQVCPVFATSAAAGSSATAGSSAAAGSSGASDAAGCSCRQDFVVASARSGVSTQKVQVYPLPAAREVTSQLQIQDQYTKERVQAYVQHLLPICKKLHLAGQLDKLPYELSIGQRQRALFLRAIAHKPRLILIDEPTSSLDPDNARSLFEIIEEIAKESQISVLLVTHDLKAAQRYRCYIYDQVHSYSEHSVFVAQERYSASSAQEDISDAALLHDFVSDLPASPYIVSHSHKRSSLLSQLGIWQPVTVEPVDMGAHDAYSGSSREHGMQAQAYPLSSAQGRKDLGSRVEIVSSQGASQVVVKSYTAADPVAAKGTGAATAIVATAASNAAANAAAKAAAAAAAGTAKSVPVLLNAPADGYSSRAQDAAVGSGSQSVLQQRGR